MTTTIDMEWIQPDEREDKREDSCWYTFSGHGHDLVVTVSRGERAISVYSDGEMDIRAYIKNGDKFEEVGSVRSCEELADYGVVTDDDLWGLNHVDGEYDMSGPNKSGYYFQFVHNSWFDLYTEESDSLAVCHTLSHAIEVATNIVNDDEDELWKTNEV